MRFFRVVAGVTLAAALSWATFANAQIAGADNESKSDEPGASAAADAEAPATIQEEPLQRQDIEEIKVISGPQGQTAFELETQRQAIIREAVLADMRMRERLEQEFAWRRGRPRPEGSGVTYQVGLQPAGRATHASRHSLYE